MPRGESNRVRIRIDDKPIRAESKASLLQACLSHGIYVPNLCHMEGFEPQPASCRLCFVAVEGRSRPVTACTEPVVEGMVVFTDTPEVRRLQKASLAMLVSVHHVDCKNCHAHKRCALQDIARFLEVGLKSKRLERRLKDLEIDQRHPGLNYYPNRCVLCSRCVRVCRDQRGRAALTFARRGFDTVIEYFGNPEASEEACGDCQACISNCPVGALQPKVT